MPPELLPIVTSDRIGTLVSAVGGFSSHLAIADIFDDHGQAHAVYLKVYRPNTHSLAGEVVRWTLGATLDVAQPARAWLCQVPTSMLAVLWPEVDWAAEWGDEIVPGFATAMLTSDAPATPIGGLFDPTVRAQLQAWPGLAATVALDEWGGNDDANLSNLIYLPQLDGRAAFATVDGGRFLGGDAWTIDSLRALRPERASARRPSKLSMAAWGAMPPARAIGDVLAAAIGHAPAFEMTRAYLYYWLSEILDDAKLTHEALLSLELRADLPWLKRLAKVAYA